nr:putative exostosin-like protein [Tanacetum cinerariifolium]
MSPVEYHAILKYRLMIPLFSVDAICHVCRKACLDFFGEHTVHCKKLPGFIYRHDMVWDVLFDICRRAGISAKKEAPVNFLTDLSDGRSTLRPADVLLFGWVGGKHACVDLTRVSHLVGLSSRGYTTGQAALKFASSKVTKHDKACIKNKHVFEIHSNSGQSICGILANNIGMSLMPIFLIEDRKQVSDLVVRFIKVLDVDRLVNNLCTVWVGRHKLHANIPRFQREPLKRHSSLHNIDGVKRGNSGDTYNSNGVKDAANSYAHVVKGSQNSKKDSDSSPVMDSDSSPVMVLDDSCLNEKDYSLCLMGKVKDFTTLANLKVVIANEGFDNIKFKYMGGYWVMMEFQTEVTKLKFQENSVMKTWFSHIQLASSDFNTDGRVRAKEVPGWIPDFVEDNDEEEDSEVGSYEEVPNGEDVKNVEDLEGDSDGEIVPDTKFEEDFPNQKGEEDSVGQGSKKAIGEKQFDTKKNSKNDVEESICSGHFKKSEVPKSGGSILQLIDDLVKVGKTMGASVGNSSGILCVWDPNMFKNTNSTVSDYFVMVRGDWMPNGKKLLIISVYAPQELSEKKMLYDYLSLVMSKWKGEVDGFDKFIEDSWKDAPIIESNALFRMMKKLKYLKEKIREGENNVVNKRTKIVKLLQEVEKNNSLEVAQKAKINSVQVADLECQVSKEDIMDGFTFSFYRRYWKLIENDVVDVSWNETIKRMACRSSKWKLKTLSIGALHGYDGKIGQKVKSCYPSLWLDIIHEVEMFKSRGIDLVSLIHSKLDNGANKSFWEVAWRGGSPFKSLFPRLYALETQKRLMWHRSYLIQ